MIAAWMLYCVAIGLALTVVGVALERGLHFAGRPTRWAWIVALVGSLAIPAAAWLRPEAFSTVAVPFPTVPVRDPAHVVAPVGPDAQTMASAATKAFSLQDLDAVLRWGWTASSILLLGGLGAAALRLAALRRRWRASLVDGHRVLVSDNVGPAVAGLWRPVVIVPEWALALSQAQQRLMLSHEEEHLRAADPWLLAFGAAALVLMPWNPALWWQVRRLRLAVEIDCDTRVLARGGTPPEYGELLLRVGQRRTQFVLAAPALGEPVSFLERRIRRMATTLPRWRWVGAAVALTVAAGALVGACEAPRPVQPEQATERAAAPDRTPESLVFRPVPPLTQEQVPSRDVMTRWMRAAIAREYPDYLTTPAKPSVDLWFHGTTGGRVIRSTRSLRGAAVSVGYKEVQAQLPEVGPMRPGMWFGMTYPLGPRREDVRAIWLYDAADSGSTTRDLSAFDEHPEILVLPWIRDGITRYYPALLQERSGPRIELWFVADPQKHVLRTVQRPGLEGLGVGIEEIHAMFPDLDASNVWGWRVAQGRGLGKLVRDNVRVVWIQLREGKTIAGSVPRAAPAVQERRQAVASRPTLSWSPMPVYPALLRSAGIRGRVVVQAIIDEAGRAEPASLKIVESAHPGFDQAAKDWMLAARFDAARVQGRAVRALMNVPVEFAIK